MNLEGEPNIENNSEFSKLIAELDTLIKQISVRANLKERASILSKNLLTLSIPDKSSANGGRLSDQAVEQIKEKQHSFLDNIQDVLNDIKEEISDQIDESIVEGAEEVIKKLREL